MEDKTTKMINDLKDYLLKPPKKIGKVVSLFNDKYFMGLPVNFIEIEIGRENVLNDNQLYLCGRQVPENWNEIKAAYLELKSNPSKYEIAKMEKSKFKVGDKVTIIKYGSLFWQNKEEIKLIEKNYGKQSTNNIIFEDENTIWKDMQPEIVGLSGIVVKAESTQNHFHYAIDGIPGKYAWYNEDQLKLK
jgi:hypothetical protein